MLPYKRIKRMDIYTLTTIAKTLEVGSKEWHLTWAYVWLLWAFKFQKTNQLSDMRLNLQWFLDSIRDIHPKRGYP